ncbi:hypothetical protein WR25_13162 isoform B [Diploscapter pachys]|uniref:Ran-GTPase activating protein 1 C-terminal domain-containing protein n=1 Tax=Diploscapter pachys TaxID=2018661 RepID=A0A2A2LQ79_9BILA|nr:hypothetical protein WR25_13162 isoform A [Diploscapter pachys]PAV88308.1 hypothetical protein WR25_13162 isoform B [Diploscapter pachys]
MHFYRDKTLFQKLIFCDMFTGRLRSEIPETIKSMLSAVTKSGAQIQALNVADNAFGPIGAESISEFLLSPACNTLQILDLNNTGLGEGAMIISKCLLEMKENAKREGRVFCLKTFKCDRNRLYSAGGSALSKAVKGLGTLEHFSMMGCTIQWQGIVDIAQSLTFNPHLKRINISDNLPGSKGSRQIAEALKPLKELEDVVLEDLLLRNAAVDVVKALCDGQHRNLKKLNLCGNQIKFDAGRAIIEIWKRNGDMPLLWLGLNAFGEDGFEEFAQMTEDYPNIDLGDPDEDEYVSGEEDDDESDTEDDDAN